MIRHTLTFLIHIILKLAMHLLQFLAHFSRKAARPSLLTISTKCWVYLYDLDRKDRRLCYSTNSMFAYVHQFCPKYLEKIKATYDYDFLRNIWDAYTRCNNVLIDKTILLETIPDREIYRGILTECIVEDIQSWCKRDKKLLVRLMDPEEFIFEYPRILNENIKSAHSPKSYGLLEPQSFIAQLENVMVSRSASILAKRDDTLFWIVYEPQAHPKLPFVANYHSQLIHYDQKKNFLLIPKKNRPTKQIDTAILLDGRCSGNYFHWVIEYLSRVYAMEEQKGFDLRDIPLLVSDSMPLQHYEALRIIVPKGKILYYSEEECVSVNKLYVLSTPTLGYDDFNIPYLERASMDVKYLKFVRNRVLSSPEFLGSDKQKYPSKIFISRQGINQRSLSNQKKIVKFLQKRGFFILRPEHYSFLEQVNYFANADIIIGVNGAALTNLIFAKSDAKVYILISEYNKEYVGHYNLAKYVAECEVNHIAGKLLGKIRALSEYEVKMKKTAQNYYVPIKDLQYCLQGNI